MLNGMDWADLGWLLILGTNVYMTRRTNMVRLHITHWTSSMLLSLNCDRRSSPPKPMRAHGN
jgi:hypothetical protein